MGNHLLVLEKLFESRAVSLCSFPSHWPVDTKFRWNKALDGSSFLSGIYQLELTRNQIRACTSVSILFYKAEAMHGNILCILGHKLLRG